MDKKYKRPNYRNACLSIINWIDNGIEYLSDLNHGMHEDEELSGRVSGQINGYRCAKDTFEMIFRANNIDIKRLKNG